MCLMSPLLALPLLAELYVQLEHDHIVMLFESFCLVHAHDMVFLLTHSHVVT